MRWLDTIRKSTSAVATVIRRSATRLPTAVAALALVAGGAAGGAMLRGQGESHAAPATAAGAAAAQPAAGAASAVSFADVVARVKPSVVSVEVSIAGDEADNEAAPLPPGADPEGPFGDMFRRFGSPFEDAPQAPRAPRQGQGSGFFVSPDGFIVTNNHVVQDARSVKVRFDDGRSVDARVVATDARTDLAVLKTAQGSNYPFVRFASIVPRTGDWVLAIGNPFGLGGTVTAGIVSARGRDIGAGPYDDFLQIDAPVNRGNSGGPVFNMNGEVVGINTAIFSPSGGNVGVAFAIPAATAQPIVETLRQGSPVVRGFLGVSLQPIDEDIARSVGLRGRDGALVAEVSADGPGARAGVRVGDVIVRADGRSISDSRDLARVVAAHRPGSRLNIELVRNGRRIQANATLAAAPADNASRGDGSGGVQRGDADAALGLSVAPAQGGGAQIMAVDPESAAASRGLEPGDVILEAGGQPCANAADLRRAADEARRTGRGAVLLRVRSGNQARYVGLPVSERG